MRNKKEIENFYLMEFLKIWGKKIDKINPDESPDFIVEIDRRKIGIELTEFHSSLKGTSRYPRREIEQQWDALQNKIMNEVQKHSDLENTFGTLHFISLELPKKSDYKNFIKELIQLSNEMLESDNLQVNPSSKYPMLKKYIRRLTLERIQCYCTWEWNHNASFIGLSEEELINTIEPKIKKVASYEKKRADELWLIIVSGFRLSQTMPMHLSDKLRSFGLLEALLVQSGYAKVYVFQYQIGVIHEWPGWIKIGEEQIYPTIDEEI